MPNETSGGFGLFTSLRNRSAAASPAAAPARMPKESDIFGVRAALSSLWRGSAAASPAAVPALAAPPVRKSEPTLEQRTPAAPVTPSDDPFFALNRLAALAARVKKPKDCGRVVLQGLGGGALPAASSSGKTEEEYDRALMVQHVESILKFTANNPAARKAVKKEAEDMYTSPARSASAYIYRGPQQASSQAK